MVDSQVERAQQQQQLSVENKVWRLRVLAAGETGRDTKVLSTDVEAARAAAMRAAAFAHANAQEVLWTENRELHERLRQAGEHGRDCKWLDAEVEAARTSAAERVTLEKEIAQVQL